MKRRSEWQQNANPSRRMQWDIEEIEANNKLANIEGKKGEVRIAG
jgi:hypothetical protein